MTTSIQDGSHRRSATRAPVGRPIKLQFDDSMDLIEGLCRNISIGGMFISFDDSRPAGSLVRFELELEDESAIRGLGEVVWMKAKNEFGGPESGFGLKFRFLEQRDRQLIFKLVSQHIKERLSKREPEAGEGGVEDTQPEALSPEALGVAVPPDPPAPEPPAEPVVPPEPLVPPAPAPVEEPSPPVASPPVASPPVASPPPVAPESVSPEPALPVFAEPESSPRDLLPALEEFAASELEYTDTGSRPMTPAGQDPIDLDPSVGETPMYELGLGAEPPAPGPDDFDLSAGADEPPAAGGVAAESPAFDGDVAGARDDEADLPSHEARGTYAVEAPPRSRRHVSLLLVVAVFLATAGAAAYLYRDQLMARFGAEPAQPEEGTEIVAGGPAGEAGVPGPPASGTVAGVAEPTATADPETAPPPPAVESPPPPAVESPPPPAVAPPPTSPPPSGAASSGADFTHLVDVSWSEVPGGIKVILTADGPIPTGRYRYFRLSVGTPREVVKLMGVDQGFSKNQMTVGGPGVQRIRVGLHGSGAGKDIHVVLDLTGPEWAITEVSNVGSRLELTLTPQ